jgi:simple sugar transport system permease protein
MTTSTAGAGPAPGAERLRQVSLSQRLLAKPAAGAFVIVVFVFLVFLALSSIRNPLAGLPPFITGPGVLNYVGVASQIGIIATSVALLMIAGEFDLSVGSLVGFSGIIIGLCASVWGLPIWLSILISMAVTTGLGVVNGLIVVRTGLPSFIVTLATLFIIAGLSSVIVLTATNITFISIDKAAIAADPLAQLFAWKLSFKFDQTTSDLSVSVVWWILIALIGAYVLGRRKFGNWISGVGGSPTAARNLGVPVARVKVLLFASTAFSASILAACQSMQFASADIQRGTGYELTAITTAVIGGCLLTGGYGSVAGTALGALALGMANIGIVYASINADWYKIAIGLLLLTAVVLNNWIRRRFAGLR